MKKMNAETLQRERMCESSCTNTFVMQRGMLLVTLAVMMIACLSIVHALPSGPVLTYVSNTTAVSTSSNRSVDNKGTITTLTMSLNQQDYKWKAYVGNVSGKLSLDDANNKAIYDWSLGTPTGEVYATRAQGTVNWASISCVNQSVIDTEQTQLSMSSVAIDNINNTFASTAHQTIVVGSTTITNSTCRSTATYINGTSQVLNETASFQEILLKDSTGRLVYTTVIENNRLGFDGGSTYDFQMLVPENESSTTPQTYFFYVELG